MADLLPIPPSIWTRFRAFLKDDRSGTIALHVKRGRVLSATISEQVPIRDPAKVVDSRQPGGER
jgi:hypothetical protein